jgi:flagellar hook-associated protein 1 FlgK
MSNLLRIGSSALNAASIQLQTTGQNIANASTPGYVRREAMLQEAGNNGLSGFIGQGVNVAQIQRVYDEFLVRESNANRSGAAQDTARSDGLNRLDNLFGDPETGMGAAYDSLVSSFADVTAHPADSSARSAVLAQVSAFASRAAQIDGQMQQLASSAHGQMSTEINKANDTLKSLAALNQRLGNAHASLSTPNNLYDERDKLLGDLNAVMRANATIGANGAVTVASSRGEPLVVGNNFAQLKLVSNELDASKLDVQVMRSNGTSVQLAPSELGGKLAGLAQFADSDVGEARARLGQITAAVAISFNNRQALGIDATGTAGQALFGIGSPTVSPVAANTGNAQITAAITTGSALKASDYSISFDGTQYSLTRLSDSNVQTFASLPQVVDGLTVSLGSGTPAAGDKFLLRAASSYVSGVKSMLTNPSRLATALPVTTVPGSANTGDLSASGLDISAIGANTSQPVSVTFTGTGTFNVTGTGTGNPTGLTYTPGMTLSYNGWSLKLSGAPKAGDTMQVVATVNPAGDNRNARAMQSLGDASNVDGAKVIDRYADLVGEVGTRAQSAKATGDMSQRLFEDAESARTSVSGVNLDEEAARMLEYQQAYQAAAKVIATANQMFQSLLQSFA